MENILKAAENFQVAPIEETINESLFLEFVNKVAIGIILVLAKFII